MKLVLSIHLIVFWGAPKGKLASMGAARVECHNEPAVNIACKYMVYYGDNGHL